jgi:hypothetical protein
MSFDIKSLSADGRTSNVFGTGERANTKDEEPVSKTLMTVLEDSGNNKEQCERLCV